MSISRKYELGLIPKEGLDDDEGGADGLHGNSAGAESLEHVTDDEPAPQEGLDVDDDSTDDLHNDTAKAESLGHVDGEDKRPEHDHGVGGPLGHGDG